MTIQAARRLLMESLEGIYGLGESTAMSKWIMEHITGLDSSSLATSKLPDISITQGVQLKSFLERLQRHEPLQYVLNESWFCGLKFYVDERVLIPRPETEELVEWIISNLKFPMLQLNILDVGTGSGCIPIALKRKLQKANVSACDISAGALDVAKLNATALGAAIDFFEMNILESKLKEPLSRFDIIVSNPPYIPEKDKLVMHPNVLAFEPSLALFVPDEDPLLFYKAIAAFGKTHLSAIGLIYLELHQDYGTAVHKMFLEEGYGEVELKEDMQGKKRMLKVSATNAGK